MTPDPHSKLRKETLRRLREHLVKASDVTAYRMLVDTNPDPWPPVWTHNDGRTYREYITQGADRFDACRDRDGKLFPLLPHQLHRQKVANR